MGSARIAFQDADNACSVPTESWPVYQRIVVSSDSIKNATATSHGRSRLEASEGSDEDGGAINRPARFICRKLREASPPRTC